MLIIILRVCNIVQGQAKCPRFTYHSLRFTYCCLGFTYRCLGFTYCRLGFTYHHLGFGTRLKYWPLSRVRGLCIILTWEDSKIWLVLKCFVYFQLELLAVIPHSGIVLGHYFLKIRLRQELLFWDSAEDGVKIWACLGLICFCPICFQSNWDIFPLWILTISILWDIFLF